THDGYHREEDDPPRPRAEHTVEIGEAAKKPLALGGEDGNEQCGRDAGEDRQQDLCSDDGPDAIGIVAGARSRHLRHDKMLTADCADDAQRARDGLESHEYTVQVSTEDANEQHGVDEDQKLARHRADYAYHRRKAQLSAG